MKTPKKTARDHKDSAAVGWCAVHEKRSYDSRKRARNAIRQINGERMRAYACDAVDGQFHIGHLPDNVRRGAITAPEVYRP